MYRNSTFTETTQKQLRNNTETAQKYNTELSSSLSQVKSRTQRTITQGLGISKLNFCVFKVHGNEYF